MKRGYAAPGRLRAGCLAMVALAGSLIAATAASAADMEPQGRLLITGSSTMAPLITHMADRYRTSHPGARITVRGVSSAQGITDTRRGLNSIGMVSREIREEERDLRKFPIALDGVCFILSHGNAVKNLTGKQLADIFTGRVTNWKDVGGRDAPISVVLRDEGGASTKLVSEYLSIRIADLRGIVIPAENAVTMKVVGRNEHAISYVSFAELNRHDDGRSRVRVLPAGGVQPSMETINNGAYPLARTLNLVAIGTPSLLARDFIRFATSGRVADIVAADGFMPLGMRRR